MGDGPQEAAVAKGAVGTPQTPHRGPGGLSSLFTGHGTWAPVVPPGQPCGPGRHLEIGGGIWGCDVQGQGRVLWPLWEGWWLGCCKHPQVHRMAPNEDASGPSCQELHTSLKKIRFSQVLLKVGLCTPWRRREGPLAARRRDGPGRSSP